MVTSIRPEVYARRCEILNAFRHNRYLPGAARLEIARSYGVGRDRISDDLGKLRAAGCLELRGARGCYHWIKPYVPGKSLPRPQPPSSHRHCLCCNAQFSSEGIHNRLCPVCRSQGDGLSGYRVIR